MGDQCADSNIAAWLKLDLLSHGIEIDSSVSSFVQSGVSVAQRKNFYNSPIWTTQHASIPQELRVLGLLVGLNSYGVSDWRLSWPAGSDALILENASKGVSYPASTIADLSLFTSRPDIKRTANLYGGAALAFFSPRSCYFFADNTACGFCSLAGTAKEHGEFETMLSAQDVGIAVRSALDTDPERIEQIMIVGGNMRDLDRGFRHHVSLAHAAATEIFTAGLSAKVSVHVATMPPRDLGLIRELSGIQNVHVMFNLEVWDCNSFQEVCPGKARDYGRDNMLRALECLREIVGPYRAHSLLVTGLEPATATAEGASALAGMGVSPIINVYHSDRHSRLGLGARPSFADLAKVAQTLQGLYDRLPLQPYWRTCGRNAIDAEAANGLFHGNIPRFLDSGSAPQAGNA